MGPGFRAVLTVAAAAAAMLACTRAPGGAERGYQVLVFTRTAGFRHESIPAGVQALRDLGPEHGFTVVATEDAEVFSRDGLGRFRVVVFLSTTGNVLSPRQQEAFESYIRGGGGFVGVHSAADTEPDWPFFTNLVGAAFLGHPAVQPATIRVQDRSHPATAHLDEIWSRTDEWYNFRARPRPSVRILLSLDESSYTGGTMGADHPHAWYQEYEGGRSFYTAGGHTVEAFAEPAFRAHLLGAIRYAAGV